jgi:hypothetical protein
MKKRELPPPTPEELQEQLAGFLAVFIDMR